MTIGADLEPRVRCGSTSGKPPVDGETGGATGGTGAPVVDFSSAFALGADSVLAGAGCAGVVVRAGGAFSFWAGAAAAGEEGGSEDCDLLLQEAKIPQAKRIGSKPWRARSWRGKRSS